jgi:hypothetical protein
MQEQSCGYSIASVGNLKPSIPVRSQRKNRAIGKGLLTANHE